MAIYDIYEYTLKAIVYIVSLVFAFLAVYSIDFNKIFRNVHPFYKRVLYFSSVVAFAFLIGSFFLQFLPNFSQLG